MSQAKLSDSEIIRRIALTNLIGYPDGIRLSKLREIVEKDLEKYLPPDSGRNGKFRGAIWDLDKRYPEYVDKFSVNPRHVFLKPKHFLFAHCDEIEIKDLDEAFAPTDKEIANEIIGEQVGVNRQTLQELDMSPRLRLILIKHKIDELHEIIENSGLKYLLDISKDDIDDLNKEDIEAIVNLRMILSIITKQRNHFFHGKF